MQPAAVTPATATAPLRPRITGRNTTPAGGCHCSRAGLTNIVKDSLAVGEVQFPSTTRHRVEPAKLARAADQRWIPPESNVTVANRRISGGMVYVGSSLLPVGGWQDSEPALIVPGLKIARGRCDYSGERMGHEELLEFVRTTPRRRSETGLGMTRHPGKRPRRHTMPSAPAAGKCGIGAGRTSVSQSWKVTGHFFRLHLRLWCPGSGHNLRIL